MLLPSPQLSSATIDALQRPFIHFQVLEGFQIAQQSPQYATPNLAKWFRKNRKLGSRDRKFVSEVIYTMIRFQDLFLACGYSSVEQQMDVLSKEDTLEYNADFIEQVASHISLPKWIVEQWHEILGEEISELAHFLQSRAPIDIRVNSMRSSRENVLQCLRRANIPCQSISNTQWGIRIEGRAHLISLSAYKEGLFEIQDAASQIFCEQLHIQAEEQILDFCAGAGGKALALASMGSKVYAVDPRSHAIAELRKRAQRSGLNIALNLPKRAVDTVIVDAPCSGSGRLRREPAIRWRWKEQDILQYLELQQQLLSEASQYVSDDGRLVYATCSLLEQENNHILDGWQKDKTEYLWPHRWNCDGFSWSIYRR